jgi:hypothetical protein
VHGVRAIYRFEMNRALRTVSLGSFLRRFGFVFAHGVS